ncbi:MAG: hypothetical protein GDA48_25275 [Hormoscilla sp. GM102CHS1]|nr:hypothetical protein [Hormoscilla sp. GM102CHS1]
MEKFVYVRKRPDREWRDYKLVNLHDEVCEAFFQDPDALEQWSEKQPLDWILTCLGDGHPGIWNVFESLVRKRPILKREVLDWFHLMENLYKVGGSGQRLARTSPQPSVLKQDKLSASWVGRGKSYWWITLWKIEPCLWTC